MNKEKENMEEKYEAMEKKLLVMEEEALSSKYITVAANCGLDVVRARVNFQFFQQRYRILKRQ